MSELVELYDSAPELFDHPDQLAERLRLSRGEVPKVTEMLTTARVAIAAIKRAIRPFRGN